MSLHSWRSVLSASWISTVKGCSGRGGRWVWPCSRRIVRWGGGGLEGRWVRARGIGGRETRRTNTVVCRTLIVIVVIYIRVISISAGQCEAIVIIHLFLISNMILTRKKVGEPVGNFGGNGVCVCVHVWSLFFFKLALLIIWHPLQNDWKRSNFQQRSSWA